MTPRKNNIAADADENIGVRFLCENFFMKKIFAISLQSF